jgi:hypothetical protein
MIKHLISNGDSWVFGSEIVDPSISSRYPSTVHVGNYDHLPENDSYRLPKIFSTKLAERFGADSINLSWPADDNQSICNRTMEYITSNYIDKGISTDDVFVIVGWSSPERARFWYRDADRSQKHIIWPSLEWHDTPAQQRFWELYVSYFWNPEEYIPRYVDTVLRFQNFCIAHGIKYLMFNAFYQGQGSGCSHPLGQDLDVAAELQSLQRDGYDYSVNGVRMSQTPQLTENLWRTVDPVRYYCKDQQHNTFRTFISQRLSDPLTGWHPSPQGHELWATELYRYITENNLL